MCVLLMGLEQITAPIELWGIGEHRLFHARKGRYRRLPDPEVKHRPEVGRAAFEQIIFSKRRQRILMVLNLEKSLRCAHGQERCGWARSKAQHLAHLLERAWFFGEEGKEFEVIGDEMAPYPSSP
jgi:hypothetical protein